MTPAERTGTPRFRGLRRLTRAAVGARSLSVLLVVGGMSAVPRDGLPDLPCCAGVAVSPAAAAAATGAAAADAAATRPSAARGRLPLELEAPVEAWIARFEGRDRRSFQQLLERRGRYADLIATELRARGLPPELTYLPMLESSLRTRAVSSAHAVGLWQFMAPTARQYGLRIDRWVDERRDPVAATAAALDYLEWLYARYDSWYLALAAYNAGPGRLDRVLARHADGRRGDDAIFWEVAAWLPRETRAYVPRLVAAAWLARRGPARGFDTTSEMAPYSFERVFVPGGTSLARVAERSGVEEDELRRLNPHLQGDRLPPDPTWALRVPPGRGADLVASWSAGTD